MGIFLYCSTESCCDDKEEEEEKARWPVAGTQMEQTEQKKVPSVVPVASASWAKKLLHLGHRKHCPDTCSGAGANVAVAAATL